MAGIPNTPQDLMMRLVIREPSSLDTGCWEWPGGKDGDGYAQASMSCKKIHVHRVLYAHFIGEIPPGLVTDHLCRNRPCCNPWHLEPVTTKENLRRGVGVGWGSRNRAKTHCPRGHPYEGDNLYIVKTGPKAGGRVCKLCSAAAQEKYRAKKTAGG
jgi:hypothetical protein